jgi:NADH:ubiquinone oxidoreductase subunit 3 (subunit A)
MIFLAESDRLVDYLGLILLLFAVGFAAVNLVYRGSRAPRARQPSEGRGLQCGLPAITDAHARFSVKFYLARCCSCCSTSVVFLYPWATFQTPGSRCSSSARWSSSPGSLLRVVVRHESARPWTGQE